VFRSRWLRLVTVALMLALIGVVEVLRYPVSATVRLPQTTLVSDLASPGNFAVGQNAALVLGQTDFVSNSDHGGSAAANTVYYPQSAAIDGLGNLWVADRYNHRILKYDKPFTNGMSASLVLGQANFVSNSANPGGVAANTLSQPAGIAFDSSGNLWVADQYNHRVLKYASPFSNGMNATLVLGQADFGSNTYNRGGDPAANTLYRPSGIAFYSGNLWVADQYNNRVLKYAPSFSNGKDAALVLGQADYVSRSTNSGGLSASSLWLPWAVAFDNSGNLWVSDQYNHRVLKYASPFSIGMSATRVLGQADFTSNSANRGGAAGAGTLSSPNAIAFDSGGNLWVADYGNHRALKYASSLSNGMDATAVLGQANYTSSSSNRGVAVAANSLWNATGLTLDSADNVVIADYANHRVLKYLSSDAWKSYSDSGHASATDSFSGSQSTVYMYGTGYPVGATYRTVFWDSSGANRGAVDATADGSGNLSSAHSLAAPDVAGDWHATVYDSTSYSPANYSTSDSHIVVDDTSYGSGYAFNVAQSAIPELPTVLAAVAVLATCLAVYWRARRPARV